MKRKVRLFSLQRRLRLLQRYERIKLTPARRVQFRSVRKRLLRQLKGLTP